MRVFLFLAGEHENRTHLTVLAHGDSGFEVRDGHQLRNLSRVEMQLKIENWRLNYHLIILETMQNRNYILAQRAQSLGFES